MAEPPAPVLDFVFEACVLIGTPLEQGVVGGNRQRIVPIAGGTFEGPRLRGRVLPGGGDQCHAAIIGVVLCTTAE